MTLKVLAMQAGGADSPIQYSAQDLRALLDALVTSEGVFSGLRVSQRAAGANFSVDVSAGYAAVLGEDVANQGKYLAQSTAVENRTIPAPPASGTRTHRVVLQIRDKLHNGTWSTYEVTIDVLADTGAGTPATPPSALSLATVSVAAAQASVLDANITNNAPAVALVPRPVWSSQTGDMSGNTAGNFTTTGAWVDISSSKWPPVAFTVPPSGSVLVAVTANVQNLNTTTSIAWCSWRGTGGGIASGNASATVDPHGISTSGSRNYGTKEVPVSGLTPGATVTLTPIYWVSSAAAGDDTHIKRGQLIVKPVA